jgi:hypothetical protein
MIVAFWPVPVFCIYIKIFSLRLVEILFHLCKIIKMETTLKQLTHDVPELPVQERAKLAHVLITSIDEGTEGDISSAWDKVTAGVFGVLVAIFLGCWRRPLT